MQAETAWSHMVVRPAAHLFGRSLLAIIAQADPDTCAQRFDGQRDRLVVAQIISVTDDVRASFIDSEHH